MVDLQTTNTALVIMAVVSVLEAVLLVGIAVGGFLIYRRAMRLANGLEERQIAPLREKMDAILVDLKSVTTRLNDQTERVDQAISETMGRVDETAENLKSSVREKVNNVAGVVRGVRAAIVALLQTNHRPKGPASAEGRT
jgi:hypothetical protein